MSKKNILNASSAAASFLSIPLEATETPEKKENALKTQLEAKNSSGTAEIKNATAGSTANRNTETSKHKNAGRKKKTESAAAEGYITRTYYITRELDKSLGHFSIEQGMDKSAVVRTALEDYIKSHS